jgi:NADH-quinone oxidoreductase subunit L
MSWVVRLIVVLPALAGLVGLLVRRSPVLARAVAVLTAAGVTVLAFTEWVAPANSTEIGTLGTLPVGDVTVPLHLLSDRVAGLVAFVVALVVLAIQVYTTWYLREDARYGQFAATVSLFAGGMLLVVQSSDLILTLVGWEIMGWCSWLLIGHDSERAAARRAAYKAFIVTRVADIGMVIGLVALAAGAGSTDLITVLGQPAAGPFVTVGLIGVLIGVAGKSGLVPFHDWLPDAMEGPTPASALIHAATMVAAGSYVVARLFGLYAEHDGARTVLAILAAVTMVWAALLAFGQADFKRLLAYSTLSQIAIMLGALAAAPPEVGVAPAVSHLIGHAFFKALLFLAAGWLAAIVGATALARMTGRLQPTGALRWAVAIGLAALAGVPPLIGFFTKDTVIEAALEGVSDGGGLRALVVVVALFVTVVLTAAYSTRAWLILERGTIALPPSEPSTEPATEPATEQGHALHHAPITLTAALAVAALAALTVLGTLFLTSIRGAVHLGVLTPILSLLLIVGTALGVWALSGRGQVDAAERLPERVRVAAQRGFGADTAYVAVGRAVTAVARVVVMLDRDVVDAYPRATAVTTRWLGVGGARLHRGVPSLALVGLLAGVVLLAIIGVTQWS